MPDEPVTLPADPWAARSRNMRCTTCVFFVVKHDPDTPQPDRVRGRCRRYAPTLSGFPIVFPDDWCGDHRLG